ncbi:MAG TPA: hypothetical protein VJQ09_06820, partial [Candidatus Limnocylindria bacterium]|nr:hypothetical protein [Candidatus Limnocylindria bacterium]
WGAFPVATAAYATGAQPLPTALGATAGALISLAQRVLSTRVRSVRRRAASVTGEVVYADGTRETIDRRSFIAAPETALKILWVAVPAAAIAVLIARWV